MQAYDQDYYLSLSSQFPLLTLDESGVCSLLSHLGYPFYSQNLSDHNITGEVLIHLDHQSLKDVGIHSVGQRLNILKTVYILKLLENIPIEEGNYVPPSEELEDGQIPSSQIIALLTERDDRIRNLETEVNHLHLALQNLKEETLTIAARNNNNNNSSNSKVGGGGNSSRPSLRSPTLTNFERERERERVGGGPHPLSNASTLSRSNSLSNPSYRGHHQQGGPRPRQVPPSNNNNNNNPNPNFSITSPSTTTTSGTSLLPDSPNSPNITSGGIDSPRMIVTNDYQAQSQSHLTVSSSSTLNNSDQSSLAGGGGGNEQSFSIDGIKTPTTPTAPINSLTIPPSSSSSSSNSNLNPSSSNPTTTTTSTTSTSTNNNNSRSREREPSTTTTPSGGTSGGDSNNPYRSFRVTLEDPCYKVLPAALKKYKINDDWRLYALFICYGNTERCLAYDEKPLLLFQRLKESNDNPVFMLRHIKDIKSPISVASAKHALRKEKRLPGVGGGVERSLMGTNRDGTVVNASGLVGNARPTRLHHPPVLLPVGGGGGQQQNKSSTTEEEDNTTSSTSTDGKKSNNNHQGYCIAIYPYLAEREDEFDVSVGDTFIILSKTKGWWVVHRDTTTTTTTATSSSNSNSNPEPPQPSKSAWVPAGCLLETSVPPLSLAPAPSPSTTSSSTTTTNNNNNNNNNNGEILLSNAASIPILPSYVVSVSTPGIALMDYSPTKNNSTGGGGGSGGGGGIGELEVKKGQSLRILKRYNHWSYAIKEDGNRGWVPSWFCGRANKDNNTSSNSNSNSGGGQGGQQQQPLTPTSSTIAGIGDSNRPVTAPTTTTTSTKPPISIAVPSSSNNGISNGGAKSAGPVLSTTTTTTSSNNNNSSSTAGGGVNGGKGIESDGK